MTAVPAEHYYSSLRSLLRPDLQLLPGKNLRRPEPLHVANNFCVMALGSGSAANETGKWIKRGDFGAAVPLGPSPTSDDVVALGKSLGAVLNPDGEIFPTQGSPALFVSELLSLVGSDDGFARALWESIPGAVQVQLAERLNVALSTANESDPATRVIRHLAVSAGKTAGRNSVVSDNVGTAYGEGVGKVALRILAGNGTVGTRLLRLRSLATFLFGAVGLGMLHEGIRTEARASDSSDDARALGVLVYTGETPGDPNDVLTSAAQISLRQASDRAYRGIAACLSSKLEQAVNDNPVTEFPFRSAFNAPAGTGAEEAEEFKQMLSKLQDAWGGGLRGAPLLSTLLRAAEFAQIVKYMCNKVGLAGPSRGVGLPRLWLETSYLASLVAGLVDEDEGLTAREWVGRAYDELGLVMGPVELKEEARTHLQRAVERAHGDANQLDELLEDALARISQRLVAAGLARQFSDGHVVVIR